MTVSGYQQIIYIMMKYTGTSVLFTFCLIKTQYEKNAFEFSNVVCVRLIYIITFFFLQKQIEALKHFNIQEVIMIDLFVIKQTHFEKPDPNEIFYIAGQSKQVPTIVNLFETFFENIT